MGRSWISCRKRLALEKASNDAVTCETIVISGGKGESAFTNGRYSYGGERNGRPFYTNSNLSRRLYICFATHLWVVSDIDDFTAIKAAGWCWSSSGECGNPADANDWTGLNTETGEYRNK